MGIKHQYWKLHDIIILTTFWTFHWDVFSEPLSFFLKQPKTSILLLMRITEEG